MASLFTKLVNYANRVYPAIKGNEAQWFNQEFSNIKIAINSIEQALKGANAINLTQGPVTTVLNDLAVWSDTTGDTLADMSWATATSKLNVFTSTLQGLAPSSGGGTTKFLRADATWAVPTAGNVTGPASSTVNDLAVFNNATGTLLADMTWATATGKLSVFGASGASHAIGIVPDPGATAGTTRFLREDATWDVPPTMVASGASHAAGFAPDPGSTAGTTRFLREDATWVAPTSAGLVYLGTVSVSGGAISDTTILAANNSTYRSFKLILKNLILAASGTSPGIQLQVHSGGSFQTTSYVGVVQANNGAGLGNTTSTSCIPFTETAANGSPGWSGEITVSNLAGTTNPKIWFGQLAGLGATVPDAGITQGGGYWNSTAAVDGFQLLANGTTWSSGSIDIYGIT